MKALTIASSIGSSPVSNLRGAFGEVKGDSLFLSYLKSLSMITSTGSLKRATCPCPMAASPFDGSSDMFIIVYLF